MCDGSVTATLKQGVLRIIFEHPKANSLPLAVLSGIAETIEEAGKNPDVRVILLSSAGERAFCAGASFEEFQRIDSPDSGRAFFMGFARVILAMKNAPQFVLARVQGKAVGGGVGLAAAADYNVALSSAAIRLSEFELGIGPFTIGPAVERRIGPARFAALSTDTDWRTAEWAHAAGLYDRTVETSSELEEVVTQLSEKLAARCAAATKALKGMYWEGTEHWATLLPKRAAISAELLLAGKLGR